MAWAIDSGKNCILFGAADPCKVRIVDVGGHLVHAHAGMAMLERADIQPDQIEQLFLL